MVGIIIINYNNPSDTINCIESIEQFNTEKIKYVIVDNNSTDDSRNVLSTYLQSHFCDNYLEIVENTNITTLLDVTFLKSKSNCGYAQGNNKGLNLLYQDSSIDYILILNNDILFIEDIIPLLIVNVDKIPNVGIVSPMLLKKDGISIDFNCARKNVTVKDIFISFFFFYLDPFNLKNKLNKGCFLILEDERLLVQEKIAIDLPSGSCMLMRKSLCSQISGFDPNTFLYYEENILYHKIKSVRKQNYLLPNLKCIHLGAASTHKMKGFETLKASVNSAQYYINKYSDANRLNKWLFSLIRLIFIVEIKLQKNITK